ncbi:unnamed protein product [Rotaria socialis]|uniref:Uncharacterized protein n=1 Tax=Rotaria socialis TaxID=392032 RepID=A0A817NBX1_9BILA|nr:unnamed protein product [Rotaria socialis]CAF3349530.1 unnamed protein product [Rotaria socialis]CAF3448868.1 unnamed protein product [Rotaria socialis]CAF3496442.1 unnamed protein product [Rotaria socialis]CAF4458826.1 unnamed protein product [Rotaria socialis]
MLCRLTIILCLFAICYGDTNIKTKFQWIPFFGKTTTQPPSTTLTTVANLQMKCVCSCCSGLGFDNSHLNQQDPDFDLDSYDSSGEEDEDTTGNCTDNEDLTENGEDYVSKHAFNVSSTKFQEM